MKFTHIFCSLLCMLLFTQCSKEDSAVAPTPEKTPDYYIANKPQPTDVDTLRILAFGNSYTQDANRYMADICRDAGLDPQCVAIYYCAKNSYSLRQWWRTCTQNENITLTCSFGEYPIRISGTVREVMRQPWDIIVFQQFSEHSTDFSTYNPYLHKLDSVARAECTNPEMCVAWNTAWNYARSYQIPGSSARYEQICQAARNVVERNGIDVVIPTGTAIENARHTSLQDDHDLTRDGTHLSFSVGCYVAACTWYEKLVAPAFGKPVATTKFVYTVPSSMQQHSQYPVRDMTLEMNPLCQRCAIEAIRNPYAVTKIE